tara:strand:+ start:5319 stop:6299 length:981 start_codon:yes stop_codon:yes gene_type:complete
MDNIGEIINKIVENLTPADKKESNGIKFSDGLEYLKSRNKDKNKLKKNLVLIEGFGGFDTNSSLNDFINNLSEYGEYQKRFDNSYNEVKKNVDNCKTKCYNEYNGMPEEKYGCDVACSLKGPIIGDCPTFDKTKRVNDKNYCIEKPYYEILDNDQSKTFLGNISSCNEMKKLTSMSQNNANSDTKLALSKSTCNNIVNKSITQFKNYMEYDNDLRDEYKNIDDWSKQIEDREITETDKINSINDANEIRFQNTNTNFNDLGNNIDEYKSKFRTYKKMSGETNDTLIGMEEDIIERTRTKRIHYYLWGILALLGISLATIQIRKRIR